MIVRRPASSRAAKYGAAGQEPPSQQTDPAVLKTGTVHAPVSQSECLEIDRCVSRLKAMIEDPERSWIGQPEPSGTFITGVRLFAYRALRDKLTCLELAAGRVDVEQARKATPPALTGLDRGQIARARALAVEVEAELRSELRSRCPDGDKGDTLG